MIKTIENYKQNLHTHTTFCDGKDSAEMSYQLGKIMFDAKKVKDECVLWIRDFFENNGKGCNAVVGISGGKDSMLLALCMRNLMRYSETKFDLVFLVMQHSGLQGKLQRV